MLASVFVGLIVQDLGCDMEGSIGGIFLPCDFYLKYAHILSPMFLDLPGLDASPTVCFQLQLFTTRFLVLETFLAQSFSSFLITAELLLLILNTAHSDKELSHQSQLLRGFPGSYLVNSVPLSVLPIN